MKEVAGTGIWLPDHDTHFGRIKKGTPVVTSYQRAPLDAALALIPANMIKLVAIDGGAHVGLMSRVLGTMFAQVFAFEPSSDVFACLQRNVKHLPNVVCVNAALGAQAGRIGIDKDYNSNTGNRQVIPGGNDVPMMKIDDMKLTVLNFLKLDVQGYEHAILQGARETLLRCRPACMVEIEDPRKLTRTLTTDPKQAIVFLEKLGAKVRQVIGHDYILSWD